MTQLMLATIFAGSVCSTGGAYPGSEPWIFALSGHVNDMEMLYEEAADRAGMLGALRADPFKFYDDEVLTNLDAGRHEEDGSSTLCADLIRQHRSEILGMVEFVEVERMDPWGNRYPPRLILITKNHLALLLIAR